MRHSNNSTNHVALTYLLVVLLSSFLNWEIQLRFVYHTADVTFDRNSYSYRTLVDLEQLGIFGIYLWIPWLSTFVDTILLSAFTCLWCFHRCARRNPLLSAFNRIEWSFIISPGEIAERLFQANHKHRAKHPHYSFPIVANEFYFKSWMFNPSNWRTRCAISHQSPMGYVILRLSFCLLG